MEIIGLSVQVPSPGQSEEALDSLLLTDGEALSRFHSRREIEHMATAYRNVANCQYFCSAYIACIRGNSFLVQAWPK